MSDDTILFTLEADGESVLSTFASIEDSTTAVEEALASIAAAGDEAFTALTASMEELSSTLATSAIDADNLGSSMDTLNSSTFENTSAINDLVTVVQTLTEQMAELSGEMASTGEATAGASEALTGLDAIIAGTIETVSGLGDALQSALGPLIMIVTAASMAGGALFKMGQDGQKGEALLAGMAGASQADIQALQADALKLGVSMDAASAGFYEVESAGYSGSQAISVFDAATRLAEGGQASESDTLSALTAVMHDYAAKASDAIKYTDLMGQAVVQGKQSMSDYASSIGPLAAAAANVGISFQEVNAAEATMTLINPHVKQDTMQLTSLFTFLSPTMGGVAGAAKKLGLAFDETHYKSLDLQGKLQYLADIAGGTNTAAFVKLTGGVRGSTAAIDLMKNHAESFNDRMKAMGGAAGTTERAFATWENTVPAHLDKVGAAFSILATRIMDAIGPKLIPVIDQVTAVIGQMTDLILNHTSQVMPVLVGLAAVIGGALVGAIAAFVISIGPVLLALAAVGVAAGLAASLVQSHADVISNAFAQMSQSAEQHTLEMQLQTNQHTLDMAHGNIDNIEMQERGIEMEMEKTHNASTRHMLQMKLDALKESLEQQQGVVKNAQKQREGIEAQLTQLVPSARLHALQMKDDALKNSKEQEQGVIDNIQHQRTQIEMEMLKTHDASTRHMLQMKLDALNHSQQQAQGVIANINKQQKGVEDAMAKTRAQMNADNGNILMQALHTWDAFRNGVANAINAVMPIIRQLGTFLSGSFQPVLKQLAETWQKDLVPAFKELQPVIKELQPVLQQVAMVVGGILLTALGLLVGILTGLARAIGTFVHGLSQIIQGVAQFVSGVKQFFDGLFSFLVDLFSGNTKKLQQDIQNMSDGISNIFRGLKNIVEGLIKSTWDTMNSLTEGFVKGIIGYFQNLYDTLVGHSIVPDMLDAILQEFTRLPDEVLTTIQNFISDTISGFLDFESQVESGVSATVGDVVSGFTSLVSQAGTWASDMMGNFVAGIQNAIGAVKNAVGNVASAIASVMKHSVPETGPLSDDDVWTAHMMDNFVRGIRDNTSKVKDAITDVASSIETTVNPSVNFTSQNTLVSGRGSFSDNASTQLLAQILTELQKRPIGYSPINGSGGNVFNQTNHINGTTIDKYRFFRELDALQGEQHESLVRGGA